MIARETGETMRLKSSILLALPILFASGCESGRKESSATRQASIADRGHPSSRISVCFERPGNVDPFTAGIDSNGNLWSGSFVFKDSQLERFFKSEAATHHAVELGVYVSHPDETSAGVLFKTLSRRIGTAEKTLPSASTLRIYIVLPHDSGRPQETPKTKLEIGTMIPDQFHSRIEPRVRWTNIGS